MVARKRSDGQTEHVGRVTAVGLEVVDGVGVVVSVGNGEVQALDQRVGCTAVMRQHAAVGAGEGVRHQRGVLVGRRAVVPEVRGGVNVGVGGGLGGTVVEADQLDTEQLDASGHTEGGAVGRSGAEPVGLAVAEGGQGHGTEGGRERAAVTEDVRTVDATGSAASAGDNDSTAVGRHARLTVRIVRIDGAEVGRDLGDAEVCRGLNVTGLVGGTTAESVAEAAVHRGHTIRGAHVVDTLQVDRADLEVDIEAHGAPVSDVLCKVQADGTQVERVDLGANTVVVADQRGAGEGVADHHGQLGSQRERRSREGRNYTTAATEVRVGVVEEVVVERKCAVLAVVSHAEICSGELTVDRGVVETQQVRAGGHAEIGRSVVDGHRAVRRGEVGDLQTEGEAQVVVGLIGVDAGHVVVTIKDSGGEGLVDQTVDIEIGGAGNPAEAPVAGGDSAGEADDRSGFQLGHAGVDARHLGAQRVELGAGHEVGLGGLDGAHAVLEAQDVVVEQHGQVVQGGDAAGVVVHVGAQAVVVGLEVVGARAQVGDLLVQGVEGGRVAGGRAQVVDLGFQAGEVVLADRVGLQVGDAHT